MDIFKKYFLSHPEVWFAASKEIDEYIDQEFGYLLQNDGAIDTIDADADTDVLDNSEYDPLALILIYDQLPRHLRRLNKIKDITIFDQKALKIVNSNINGIESYQLPIERCFFLMPLRHTFDSEIIENQVVPLLLRWRQQGDCPEYQRFYRATLYSLADLKKGIANALPRYEIDPDVYDTRSTKIIGSTDNSGNQVRLLRSRLMNAQVPIFAERDNFIVSLSGGVDSMVCLKMANDNLRKAGKTVVAVHINYGNRESSDMEEEVCRHYCRHLGIPLYVRQITEIKRDRSFDRTLYEEVTKRIRFNAYREFPGYAVVLGHNKDDCLENVFSNIRKKIHYDNLFGMSPVSAENEVTLLRPFLETPKSQIIDWAIQHNIPFVYDSTPKWSDRGKMRDILIPSIHSFDPYLLDNFLAMAEAYREIYQIAERSLDKVELEYGEDYVIFPNSNYNSLYYWKKIFARVTRHLQTSMVSTKAVEHFIESYDSNKNIRIELSRSLYVIGNKCILRS